MWPSIINSLALAASIILVFILNILPARKGERNQYLQLLLIYLILHLLSGLLMFTGIMSLSIYAIFSLSLVILYGPTFYFYIRTFHGVSSKSYLWHIVLLELILWSFFLLQILSLLELPKWIYYIYFTVVLLLYFVASLRTAFLISLKAGKDWMRTLTFGFGGLIVLYIIESIWMGIDFDAINQIVLISTTAYNIFCFFFLLIAIKQIITKPEAFSDMKIRIPYRREKLSDITSELDSILSYVLHKKEYQNPELNRHAVSEATGLRIHRISEIINSEFEKNFNEWINDFRVEEAKMHLRSSQLSIKEICYGVGFNSKSAFNKAFKNRTRLTPTEYRLQKK